MTNGRRIMAWIPVLALLLASVYGQTPPEKPAFLDGLRTTYENELARIQREHETRIKAWPDQYAAELSGLQKQKQKAGDLDGYQVFARETERFKADQTVPNQMSPNTTADLALLQTKYRDLVLQVKMSKIKGILELHQKYVARLEESKKQFTINNRIEEAVACKDEIERVNASPEIASAQFDLAEHEMRNPARKQEVPPEPVVAEKQPEKPSSRIAPSVRPSLPEALQKATAGSVVLDEPAVPPAVQRHKIYSGSPPAGGAFKSVMLRPTDQVPMASQNVSLMASLDTAVRMQEPSLDNGCAVRVQLRTSRKDVELSNLSLLVQYYLKSSSARGKIEPVESQITSIAVIPKLASEWIYVDFDPVPPAQTVYMYSYPPYTTHYSSYYGFSIYGVMITAFDSSGNPVFQAYSAPAIKDFSATAVQAIKKLQQQNQLDTLRRAYETAREVHYRDYSNAENRNAYHAAQEAYQSFQRNMQASSSP